MAYCTGDTYDQGAPDEEAPPEESEVARADLYTILGLSANCTPEEIKRAYKKRALETHPDRNPHIPNDEEFKRVAKAKDVLSDPQKRKYYDVYGEDGVEFYERWSGANANEMLGQVGPGGIVCFFLTNLVCVGFLLLIPIFVIIREDDWMWGWMLAPLWVADALVLLMLAVVPLLPYNMNQDADLLATCMWLEMAQMVCFITWQVFICINLDHQGWTNWITAFVPMLLFQAISTAKTIRECLPEQYQQAYRTKAPGAGWGHFVYILYRSVQELAWWSIWVLIPLRMDKSIGISWWLVAVPLYVLIGFGMYASVYDSQRMHDCADTDEVVYEQAFSRWKFGLWLLALVMVVVVCLYIEGVVQTGIYFVFLPIFLLAGLFLFAVCYTSVTMISASEAGVDQRPHDEWAQPEDETGRDREGNPLIPDEEREGDYDPTNTANQY